MSDSKSNFSYEYPRPALGTDLLLFSRQEEVYLLLIERGKDPYQGLWAFPGGFVEEGESCEEAVVRELEEETGLTHSEIFEIGVFSKPGRDPRGWVVSVAFAAWVDMHVLKPVAGDDAKSVKWFPLSAIPPLAFDHQDILNKARKTFVEVSPRF